MEETVRKNCPHKDCIYRGRIAGYETCDYILVEHRSRSCSIAACDKYKKGKRNKRSELGGVCWDTIDIDETL